jgi:extracellular factor (EF) 3-hydroxypalmitic acid methyl ester biosynthesis protein
MRATTSIPFSELAAGRPGSDTNQIHMTAVETVLNSHRPSDAVEMLRSQLHSAFGNPDLWARARTTVETNASLIALLSKCPYIQRARTKPRGYAGDAVMMDYLYGLYATDLLKGLDAIGEEIFRTTTNSTAASAVRYRRRLISNAIDVACQASGQSILSVACGHLREAECSLSVNAQQFGSFYALDHDPESLKVVAESYGHLGVTPVRSSVSRILAGKPIPEMPTEEPLHFIYSAGLYDYLDDPTAAALTAKLAGRLAPQGRILLANFLPGHKDVGFMEAVMDWHLIYRTPAELESIVVRSGLAVENTHVDPSGSIVFVTGVAR